MHERLGPIHNFALNGNALKPTPTMQSQTRIPLLLPVLSLVLILLCGCANARVTNEHVEAEMLKLPGVANRVLQDWQVRILKIVLERRLRFERLLAATQTDSTCVKDRDGQLKKATADLDAARSCKYNGLSYSDYEKSRDVCFTRGPLLREVGDLKTKCKTLSGGQRTQCHEMLADKQAKLALAQTACEKIGRAQVGFVPQCTEIAPLKAELERVTAIVCDGSDNAEGLSTVELEQLVEKANVRIEELLKGDAAPQSNDPRFPINF